MIAEILEIVRADHSRRKSVNWMDEYMPVFKDFLPWLQMIIQNAKQASLTPGQTAASRPREIEPTPTPLNAAYDSGMRGEEKPKG